MNIILKLLIEILHKKIKQPFTASIYYRDCAVWLIISQILVSIVIFGLLSSFFFKKNIYK